jgi:PPOX class probable F420-dependent enzyme
MTHDGTDHTVELPQEARAIFEKKAFVFIGTNGADGYPHVTAVWADIEDGRLAMNTAEGRVKHRNLTRDPRVSVSAVDPDNPYNTIMLKGRVRMTTEGGDEHIDRLAKKYIGQDPYPWRKPGEVRVKVLLELDD